MTADLFWLTLTALMTAFMTLPYVLERILRVGIGGALAHNSDSGTGGFDQPAEKPAKWAKRSHAAHRNAVEGLPIFAALVLVAHIAGITGGGMVAVAAETYFFARLAHYLLYLAGVPVLRTLSFMVALGATFAIGYFILTGAA